MTRIDQPRAQLPKIRELKVSQEEILDWVSQPQTRLFFKALASSYKDLQRASATAYDPESADKTLAKLGEITGAMNVLLRLLNSVHGDDDSKVMLFSEADLEEVLADG